MNPLDRLASFPHLECGLYPTPIEELSRFRAALGSAPRIWIKRDDLNGAGFGGNKVRKLEYLLAQALRDGAQVIITTGAETSNHCCVTAALCAHLGLECRLVLNRSGGSAGISANLFLDRLYGADVTFVDSREERRIVMRELAESLRAAGKVVAEIPLGASTPLGALGYVRAAGELAGQLDQAGVRPAAIFHSSSSGGTQSGILAGCILFGLSEVRVVGVSPDDPASSIAADVVRNTGGISELLGAELDISPEILDAYAGRGYGIPTRESEEATRLLARTEGIVLDPVYTSKAMAALIDLVRAGVFRASQDLLFWHTGGQLAHFVHPSN